MIVAPVGGAGDGLCQASPFVACSSNRAVQDDRGGLGIGVDSNQLVGGSEVTWCRALQ